MKRVIFNKDVVRGYNKNNIYIEKGVIVKKGAIIWSGNCILGKSVICTESELYPNNMIESSYVGQNSKIGPSAHLRKDSFICTNCRIGNFVETKNCEIGSNSKVSHLTYVGDATIGSDCNIGCGVVFCNYDGKDKHHTKVGDKVFIGCNCNLIAPITIESESYIAAGTTVTTNVPKNALAIGRVRQENKLDYKNNKYKMKNS